MCRYTFYYFCCRSDMSGFMQVENPTLQSLCCIEMQFPSNHSWTRDGKKSKDRRLLQDH